MIDENELLRRFRHETPPPTHEAWKFARQAIANARAQEHADASVKKAPPSSWERSFSNRWHVVRGLVRYDRRAAIFVALVVVGLSATIASQVIPSSGLSRPLHTSWHAARALPPSGTHLHATKGTWLLADFISTQGWQQNTSGPEPGNLTCPTSSVCFVTGDNATSNAGPEKRNALYVSYDGAQSWSVLTVANGVDFTTPLSCASATVCAAGATYNGQPVMVSSVDGAHSFTIAPLPSNAGRLFTLSCPTSTFCAGLATEGSGPSSQTPVDATILSTTDLGANFTNQQIVVGESMQTLTCPVANDCVAAGTSDALGVNDLTAGVTAVTSDGGANWSNGALPSGFGVGTLSRLSCSSVNHCMLLGYIAIASPNVPPCSINSPPLPPPNSSASTTTTTTTPPSPQVQRIAQVEASLARQANLRAAAEGFAFSCSGGGASNDEYISDVATSNDGGLTWTPLQLPSSAPEPQMFDVYCATNENCVVTGSAANPQSFGHNGQNGGSAIVLVTNDGGAIWNAVTFAAPSNIPSGVQTDAFMAVGDVACPRSDQCVALGVSDQGSKTTPVYVGGFTVAPPTAR